MRTVRGGVWGAASAALGLALTTPAAAETNFKIEHHVAIFGGNIDPWSGGQAIIEEKHFTARTPEFAVKVDPELSPLPALAQALGVPFDPPRIGYAELSGEVHGHAGFNFGYSFGAGELSIVYPMIAEIRLNSSADNDVLAAGYAITIATSFSPGFSQPLRRTLCDSRSFGGCAVSEAAREMLANVHLPDFQTVFADARAYADFDYDVGVGIAATVGIAKAGNYCFSCFSRRFKIRGARVVPLIDVTPQSVFVAGLGRKQLFPATFETPYGNVYANLPQPRVGMERMEGSGMSGEEEPTIIAFEAAVEKLVPVLGPFLSNNAGPLGYTLLETQGGPSLNLIQSFRFAMTPMVTLRFSHPVALAQEPGKPRSEITMPLGQSVRIVAPESARGPFAITPTYWLEARVKNSTKLAMGLGVTARMLKLTLAGVNAGPFGTERFHEPELIGVELCCPEYELQLAKATATPISFTLAGQLEGYADQEIGRSNIDGLTQPVTKPGGLQGSQQIPEGGMQHHPPAPSPYGSERIEDEGITRDGPSYVPEQPAPPPPDESRADSLDAVRASPADGGPTAIHRGPRAQDSEPAERILRRLGQVRGQIIASENFGERLGDVDYNTSPTVTDGDMTVYVAGIPTGGMRTMSSTPSATIRPRDMTPKVIHALNEMGALEDVSTTDNDPRVIDELDRRQ